MANLFAIVCFLFLVTETLTGTVANGSIVLINVIDWLRTGKLSPADLILIFLGLSRLLLQGLVIQSVTLFIFPNTTVRDSTQSMLMGLWMFTSALNVWLAACLSVFYLAKIAIFSHPVFLQLKQRFSGLVPWLLLGLVVTSAVHTIVISTSWDYALFTCNPFNLLSRNRSNTELVIPLVCQYIAVLIAVFYLIPFLLFLSSSTFLIISLWKHMRCIQLHGTGTRDLNTQAHLSAIKALASFAVLYLFNFAVVISQSALSWYDQRSWTIVLFIVRDVYPSGHAIILILMNPKLKQAWVRTVHRLKCCLSEVPS